MKVVKAGEAGGREGGREGGKEGGKRREGRKIQLCNIIINVCSMYDVLLLSHVYHWK